MSSGFVTETEIAEARRKRQEEWDLVRSADQPIDAPEEPYDPRSLFDRLQEQKQKKDMEYEEAHKLKNMIKGLDDDEIEFLDLVDRTKMAVERKKTLDEKRELDDYRNRVASLQERSLDQKLQAEISVAKQPKSAATTTRQSQTKLLKGAVVKKNGQKKRKLSDSDPEKPDCDGDGDADGDADADADADAHGEPLKKGALTCIGILPGLGCYYNSSDSELSSDLEGEAHSPKLDMLGRKIAKKQKEEN